ncbi:uncharacterized protein si:ch73-52p7.1 [Clupea harengus]|uniref:Uncharacterized protein si:ch73-52p7.1 n=1 Tax=Clupea harengus TaxID=7950 RepID=A0A6P8G7J0_CLUHA|nr:uncharacterized protein si:ch73-52p7.1 [Clupea harengus]XP_031435359.1 uncharacterized protein si:ch73-52p7.1 [Clupea harengus]
MSLLSVCEQAVLSCLLWLTIAPGLLHGEFHVARVTDHSLCICLCVRELPHCSEPDSSECSCKDHPLSWLQRAEGTSLVQRRRFTVWYSSPPHVALLLHNAEVRHLSLVRCWALAVAPGCVAASALSAGATAATAKLASPEHFVVQRLERLTMWPPVGRSGSNQDLFLGREMGAPHHEEARIAVINTSVLAGDLKLRAYTVSTGLDGNGLLPFPNLHTLPREGLPDSSSIFVTFLY